MIFEHKTWMAMLAGLFAAVVVASCLDVSPIEVASQTNTTTRSRECAACYVTPDVPGPGCGNEVTACYAEPKCKKAFQCSVERGCFQGARERLISCGQECASQAGFTSLADKAYLLASSVYTCLLGACKDACFGTSVAAQDAAPDVVVEAAVACGSPNAENNELGLGGYCKTTTDCASDAGLRFCAADFGGGNFCTGLCAVDEECGSGVHCAHTAQGSGCVPLACQGSPDAGVTNSD